MFLFRLKHNAVKLARRFNAVGHETAKKAAGEHNPRFKRSSRINNASQLVSARGKSPATSNPTHLARTFRH